MLCDKEEKLTVARRIGCLRRISIVYTHSSRELQQLCKKQIFDIVIIHDHIRDCFEAIAYIDEFHYSTRVVFFSSSCEVGDHIAALESGADEVLSYSCDIRELELRLERLRYVEKQRPESCLRVGNFRVYPQRELVFSGDDIIPFRKREFQVFYLLCRHKNLVVTRDMIIDCIWGEEIPIRETIDSYVARIRLLLKDERKLLKTVWGIGYILRESTSY